MITNNIQSFVLIMFVTYRNAGPKVTPTPSFFTNDKALLLSHLKRTDKQTNKNKNESKNKNHNTKLQGMH